MKKIILSMIAMAIATMAVFACASKEATHTEQEHSSGQKYTCPMHPEVIADKPGSCPKCGMDLVLKK